MSASFYDLLKYAATGISSPDMTYFDKMRASTLMGGVVQTLTGQPPLSFKSDGSPLISWSMKGNGEQTGTPTPDNPIMPTFCGVRTMNLFDKSAAIPRKIIDSSTGEEVSSYSTRSASDFIEIYGATVTLTSNQSGIRSGAFYDSDKVYISGFTSYGTITVPNNARYMRFTVIDTAIDTIMLNLGSTALDYEPYGWAEKITCAGQTTPVYLGQVSTVRRIKKLVLDGTENWNNVSTGNTQFFYIAVSNETIANSQIICTHFVNANIGQSTTTVGVSFAGTAQLRVRPENTSSETLASFKQWLAEEYSNGTPVTVWYVLATPETAIVNEPLCKIGDYADELSSDDAAATIPTAKGQNTLTVETDLQPSEMTITFKG